MSHFGGSLVHKLTLPCVMMMTTMTMPTTTTMMPMMMMTCVTVTTLRQRCYDDFRTIWHLTRSQYGRPMFLDSFWCRKSAFFHTSCPNFGPKFGLEIGRRLCYEDLLLLEFLTMHHVLFQW